MQPTFPEKYEAKDYYTAIFKPNNLERLAIDIFLPIYRFLYHTIFLVVHQPMATYEILVSKKSQFIISRI